MNRRELIAKEIAKIEQFKPKRKINLNGKYLEEYKTTKMYKNSMNWYNSIKMSNSYAEAKQHNII